MINNFVVFTVSKNYKNNVALISITTRRKEFIKYNMRNVSSLRVLEKMEELTVELNSLNFGVLFEID